MHQSSIPQKETWEHSRQADALCARVHVSLKSNRSDTTLLSYLCHYSSPPIVFHFAFFSFDKVLCTMFGLQKQIQRSLSTPPDSLSTSSGDFLEMTVPQCRERGFPSYQVHFLFLTPEGGVEKVRGSVVASWACSWKVLTRLCTPRLGPCSLTNLVDSLFRTILACGTYGLSLCVAAPCWSSLELTSSDT